MLTPDELEAAGDLVAGVYTDIEAQLLDHLVSMLLEAGPLDQQSMTALALLSQTHAAELQAIIDRNQEAIDDAVRETAEEYLRDADEADIDRVGGGRIWPRQVQGTVDGMATVLARDNIAMAEGARTAFLTASGRAVTQVNTGIMTTEQALHAAVRDLERNGIDVITYKDASGRVTVRNRVDVAVRRHIRTQIAQDAGRMTMQRMDDLGLDLVEVSSHYGARPEHAAWQGQCYSLHGAKSIEGMLYRDFYAETRYGEVDGLDGANCRHSFGPYRHGMPRAYDPDPKSETGIPSDEAYQLTQKQRAREREIRAAKRELRGAQQLYDASPTLENLAALNAAKARLARQQEKMRSFIDETNARCKPGTQLLHRNPKREWAGDMPKGVRAKKAGQTLDEYLDSPAVSKKLESSGISRTAARHEIRMALNNEGLTTRDFSNMRTGDQGKFLQTMLTAVTKRQNRSARKGAGGRTSIFKFKPAKSIAEAERYARTVFGSKADYRGLFVGAANALNESIAYHIHRFPKLNSNIAFVGSSQARRRDRIRIWSDYYYQDPGNQAAWRARGLTDADMRKRAERMARRTVGNIKDEWASSYSPGPQHPDYDMRGICMNEKWWKDKKAYEEQVEVAERGVKSRFHPEGTASVRAIADHELGHQLDTLLGISNDAVFIQYRRSLSDQEVIDGLSRYALKNDREFVAEAWSEYLNNEKPRPHASFVGKLIENKYAAI